MSDKRSYYPLFLNIESKMCVVFGGGNVAERKVAMLKDFGAHIRVVSPVVTKWILNLSRKGKIELLQREYREGDVKGACLVIAATNNRDINTMIRKEAESLGIPINVVDDPELCDFIVPSILRKGPITIAISTSGTLPMLSKRLKEELNRFITEDHVVYAKKIGSFRSHLIKKVKDPEKRAAIMAEIGKMDMKDVVHLSVRELLKRYTSSLKKREYPFEGR
ncbi:MAG: bifunctional precorrin-2 dehydrogenase/sirohydrochlorin ferrochelatase [Syntrophorhabdaceae bacterium]|nr:bifunctional precorrin-2 dehydrogenase/sirohydrochlorin ferrochelatase [Syntrophorhabdaceae bacterium]